MKKCLLYEHIRGENGSIVGARSFCKKEFNLLGKSIMSIYDIKISDIITATSIFGLIYDMESGRPTPDMCSCCLNILTKKIKHIALQ